MKSWFMFLLALITTPAWAGISHDPALTWRTLHSPHFRLHYHDGLEPQARQAIVIAEKVHDKLNMWFKWQPREPVDMVITDEIDYANGFTTPFPANHIELWVTPFDDGLFDFSAWLESLITHEYVHLLHLDAVDGPPETLRDIFGRHPFSFPAIFQPNWVVEGIATYVETDVARGVGRGQASYFDMLMRAEVTRGIRSIRQANQPTVQWPGGTVSYLYGVEFMKFVAEKYGDDKLREWITRYRAYLIPWRVSNNMNRVFGKPVKTIWDEFSAWLGERYRVQNERIATAGVIEGDRLSEAGYNTSWTRTLPDGTVYFVRDDGHSHARLMRIKPGTRKVETLIEVGSDARIDAHPDAGVVIAQAEFHRNANVRFDLYRYDPARNDLTRLTHQSRYRFAAWTPDGKNLVATRHEAGQFRLDLLTAEGALVRTLWQGTQGEIVSTLHVSPTAPKVVSTLWTQAEGWQLAEFSLTDGNWTLLTHDTATPLHPTYTPDGNAIIFSADYDGVFNVNRYDPRDGRVHKLTNVRGGAFYPGVTRDGMLNYLGYLHTGYDVYRVPAIATAPPEATRVTGSSGKSNGWGAEIAAVSVTPTDYSPVNTGWPTYWQPILGIGNDFVYFGAATGGSDALRRHYWALSAAYEFTHSAGAGAFSYLFDGWFPVFAINASRDVVPEYDDEGDTLLQLRSSELWSATMSLPWIQREWRAFAHFGVAGTREYDIETHHSVFGEPEEVDRVGGVALSLDTTAAYPLGISRTDGRVVSLAWESSDVFNSDYTGQAVTVDWREYLGLFGDFVLTGRIAAGRGDDGIRPYTLGGVFTSDELLAEPGITGMAPFNRREFILRGYKDGLPQLTGTDMQLFSGELRFPVVRVERGWMAPPLGLDHIRGKGFYDIGAAWSKGSGDKEYYAGIGTEATFALVIGYRIPLDVTIGFARGLDDDIGEDQVYVTVGGTL